MKIICNKAEFAKIVLNCYRRNVDCNNCLIFGICDGKDSVLELVDVEEDRIPSVRHLCITCRWYKSLTGKSDKTSMCGKHTGLASVTPYTSCSYWEPVEIVKVGEKNENTTP